MSHAGRVFKLKTFDRWARGVLTDAELLRAAEEVRAGRFEADLGGGVCKKRIALPGRGKSGSTRTLVAKQVAGALIFLAGRQKNDPGTDFSEREVAAAKIVAKGLQRTTEAQIEELLIAGVLKEICHAPDNEGGAKS